MSTANACIPPTTAAVTTTPTGPNQDIDATEADKVLLVINGPVTGGIVNPLGAAETVSIYSVDVAGNAVPVYDQTLAQASLKAALSSILLEGGFYYRLVKTATAASIGVNFHLKRAQGS